MANDGTVKIGTELDKSGLSKGLSGLGGFAKKGFSVIGSAAAGGAKIATGAIAAVGTSLAGLGAAGVKYNASIQQYETSFEVMTGSAEKAAQVIDELKKVGAATPFELPELADTTQLLMNYGFTADEAMDKMMMMGDISQGSADKMSRIAMAYGQMSSAGKVSLEDVKQMIEAGFNPLQEISESTGESMDSLYDRISKGTISVDEITASMQRATSEGGKYYKSMEKQSQTINGMISTLKDNAQQLLGEVVQPITESVGSTLLPAAIDAVEQLTEAFKTGGTEGLIGAGSKIISNLLLGIAKSLPNLITAAADVIQSITENLTGNLPQIMSSGEQILEALVSGILSVAGSLAELAFHIISELASHLIQSAPELLNTGYEMIAQIGAGLQQAIPMFLESALPLIQNFTEFLKENAGRLVDAGIQFIYNIVDGLIAALPDLIAYVPTIVKNVADIINENLPKILFAGANIIKKLLTGIIQNIPNLIAEFPKIVSAIISVIGAVNWLGLGKTIITGIWNGVKALFSKIPDTVKSIATNAKNMFQNIDWRSLGTNLITKIGNGISSLVTSIPSKLKGIASSAKKAFTEIDWLSVGKNIISGIASGVSNFAGNLVDAAVSAAENAIETVKGWLGIHSPSKRARDEIGVNMIAGVSEGVEEETPNLEKASVKSVGRTVDAMKKTAAADFVLAMQEKSYRAADNNEIAAREKYRNNGYEPDEPDDDPSVVVNNTFHVDGKELVNETVKKTKKEISKEQKKRTQSKGGEHNGRLVYC